MKPGRTCAQSGGKARGLESKLDTPEETAMSTEFDHDDTRDAIAATGEDDAAFAAWTLDELDDLADLASLRSGFAGNEDVAASSS